MPRLTAAPDPVNPCLAGLDDLLARLKSASTPNFRIGIAYSGGADSSALLHALAARLPGRVDAIHVHHGLQAAADQFVLHCQTQCAPLNVPLHVVYVDGSAAQGESPEDAARKARYAALAKAGKQLGVSDIVLAQHADDQVETLLLALTRGAGLPGLAAMPAQFERAGLVFHRPLLAVTALEIRLWLRANRIDFIEDPSNADESLTRNRIRKQLLPALEASFPGFRSQFARSARHAAQGKRLLASLAELDLAQTGVPPIIAALQKLNPDRQANALRHWLKSTYNTAPSDSQLSELIKQITACRTRGHRIQIKIGAGQVQRAGASLVYQLGSQGRS
jgi:tRNA(Ile)-lysidine synthase